VDGADLAFAGAARQAELVRSGEVAARELVEACLERIERHDPQLNAYRVVFGERALTEAAQADARRRAGDGRPLLGVPIAVKDDVDVAGELTARGTRAYDAPAAQDAELVRRLRAAGAIVLGKTHVPELEILPVTESPTWGVTRNPWDLERTPGGSSGGSGAAVAAGLAGAAVGSDGGGSIRIPAGCCGVFGLKPQRGRVPEPRRRPWADISAWGPLARRVADAGLLLDVLAGDGGFAAAAARPPGRLRVALSYKLPAPIAARADGEQRGAVETLARVLRGLGHDVVAREPEYGQVANAFTARYLRGIRADVTGAPHPERLARRTRGFARLGAAVPDALLRRALAAEAGDAERLNRVLRDADVLMTPLFTRRAVPIGTWEGRSALWTLNGIARWMGYCPPWNHTGQPAAAVPVGLTADGFPLAAQLVARPGDEATLLSLAAQLEAEIDWPRHRPPAVA
jgi:amidase